MPGTCKRLAIVGGGSSGLISLKVACDKLTGWEIVCFEKSNQNVGCWGQPYPGFVSTSTKYTTQFACYPLTQAETDAEHRRNFQDFFREAEYGAYLQNFIDHFQLADHIQRNSQVVRIQAESTTQWRLTIQCTDNGSQPQREEIFDALIVCTGLAASPKSAPTSLPTLTTAELHSPAGLGHVRNRRIVVLGGGESAVDYAVRLSRPELNNKVYLSLASGIRVSPRYHPIRGVPSDFLRNRLMLSIHADLRNWIGQRFVEARIQYQELFERWFPNEASSPTSNLDHDLAARQKYWAYLLTKRAKDRLFNMFHNKSDGFLEAVARGEIEIVGKPLDDTYQQCESFHTTGSVAVEADLLVPAIGFRSTLNNFFDQPTSVRDFYLGCAHAQRENLFLVGFARPIIGNIPTISEVQAHYVCGLLAGTIQRPKDINELHCRDAQRLAKQFPKLNLDAIYPVEMFPYCDLLSQFMGSYPSRQAVGSWREWVHLQLTPATTMAYFLNDPN